MTGTARNLSDAMRLREGVALYARLNGFADAKPRPMRQKPSGTLADLRPDVDGLPNVWLDASSRISYKFGPDLDAARGLADDAGRQYAVLVQHRAGRQLADSFAVMSLADFVRLMREKT